MKKEEIIRIVIERKKNNILYLEGRLAGRREDVRVREGRVSDAPENPRKRLIERLILLEEKINREKKCLKVLQSLPTHNKETIGVGSLVTIKCGNTSDICLIVPGDGCCSSVIEGKTILCASVNAPFIRIILDKKQNEEISFRGNICKILKVQ